VCGRWNDSELLGDEGRPAVVMMSKKMKMNSARARPEEDAKEAMVEKNKKMVLECPVLPCWDETDDGVPSVRQKDCAVVEMPEQRLQYGQEDLTIHSNHIFDNCVQSLLLNFSKCILFIPCKKLIVRMHYPPCKFEYICLVSPFTQYSCYDFAPCRARVTP